MLLCEYYPLRYDYIQHEAVLVCITGVLTQKVFSKSLFALLHFYCLDF